MRPLTTCASLTAVLVAVSACGGSDDDPTTTQDCAATPQITVTNAGSEPHKIMEASPNVGDSSAIEMRMTIDTSVVVDGQEAPAQADPPMVLGLVFTIEEVTDDEIAMAFGYDSVEVEGNDDPALQETLDSITSMTGTIRTTRTGAFIDGELNTDGLDATLAPIVDQLEGQMADMTVPMPSEPVGQGAEWDMVSQVESGGITFCNRASYQLAEFDGDNYQLQIELTQEALTSSFEDQGVSIEVVSGTGSASGQTNGSLSFPIAVSGSTEATTQMVLKITQGEEEVDQEVEVNVDMELSPRE